MPNSSNMSKETNLAEVEFKTVAYKRKKPKSNYHTHLETNHNSSVYNNLNFEAVVRRINDAKQDILISDLHSSVLASLREGLKILQTSEIKEIICFGLGRIGECMIARYQLALLLCLRDIYNVKIFVYDPVFNDQDRFILNSFDFIELTGNIEGKYPVKHNTTLFYLPHCPKQLTNNLLWANWGLKLSYCIIVANSFTKILESNSKRHIAKNAEYILKVSPYMTELAVINSFKYFDIFNDTAIHIFPWESISLVSDDYWNFFEEPQYPDDDLEFIANKLHQQLKL